MVHFFHERFPSDSMKQRRGDNVTYWSDHKWRNYDLKNTDFVSLKATSLQVTQSYNRE
jgi:hypothetical protein